MVRATSSTGCEVMRSSGCMEETGSRFGSKRQRSRRNADMIELDWIHPMWGLGCTLPKSQQEGGFRLAPEAPGSIPMERLSAPERTREELRALMNGDLGTAAGRSDLVRLALRLIVEEALEGEVSDVLGRERYERGEGEKAGYRNGYRTGKVKTAEGAVEYSAPQVRDTPDSGDMRTEKEQRINRPAHWGSARGEGARPGRGARGETAGCSRALKWSISQNCGGASSPRAVLPPTRGRKGRAFSEAKVRAMAKTHRLPRLFRRKGKKEAAPGSPGVARALWLAGVARCRPEWRELAIEAMAAVYRRPFGDRQIDSPTFCHGVAGLLQATLRFANENSAPHVRRCGWRPCRVALVGVRTGQYFGLSQLGAWRNPGRSARASGGLGWGASLSIGGGDQCRADLGSRLLAGLKEGRPRVDTPTEKSRKVSAKGDERGRRLYEPLTGGQIARGLFGGGASGACAPIEGREPKPAASVAGGGSRRDGPRISRQDRRHGPADASRLGPSLQRLGAGRPFRQLDGRSQASPVGRATGSVGAGR